MAPNLQQPCGRRPDRCLPRRPCGRQVPPVKRRTYDANGSSKTGAPSQCAALPGPRRKNAAERRGGLDEKSSERRTLAWESRSGVAYAVKLSAQFKWNWKLFQFCFSFIDNLYSPGMASPAGGRFRFLVPPSGTICLSTLHLRRHLRSSDNDSKRPFLYFPVSCDSCVTITIHTTGTVWTPVNWSLLLS